MLFSRPLWHNPLLAVVLMDSPKVFRFLSPCLNHILINVVKILNLIVCLIMWVWVCRFNLLVGLIRQIFFLFILLFLVLFRKCEFAWLSDYDEWTLSIDFVGIKICDQAFIFSSQFIQEFKLTMLILELHNFVCAKNYIYNESFVEWIKRLGVKL